MTRTGTAKPGVSPATLAGQIDLLKGDPGGALRPLDMTIIGRLEICGYNSRFNKSFSYVCSFEESKVKAQDVEAILEGPATLASLATRRLRDGPSL
ncbi:hypothetical protein [Rhizobium sp. ZW T2_16]|uniref:hypothetical protein n=1 Tax=Rhizobium sp. ZW T2_16 TaxID=3378083 RepID=UPI0038551940